MVSEDELVTPEDPGAPEDLIGPIVPDIVEQEETSSQEERFKDEFDVIEESVAEEESIEELPEFPETP